MDPVAYLFSLETLGIKFGLGNIRMLCASLDHPERAYTRVLVAGTNGKGSVTVMTETALRAAGHRTARYTSPHLVRLEERFVTDGHAVATEDLKHAADAVQRAAQSLLARGSLAHPPTFFEATTAVAFELFRRAGVAVAVLEVGLGGRLDATNVEPAPVTAITNIDLDHQQYLGHSVSAIAREKAGVIHPGTTTVLGDANPEVVEVVADVCRERGARLVRTAEVARAASELQPDGYVRLELSTARRTYGELRLSLRGRHQAHNALTAAVLLEELDAAGIAVPPAAVATGLTQAAWPGRLELFAHAGRRVLLDGAHNPAGARALAGYLRELYPAGVPIVFAAMRDKDVPGMLTALAPAAAMFVLTEVRNPRTLGADALAAFAQGVAPRVPRKTVSDPARGLDEALGMAPLVCVAGSLFLVGELRAGMERAGGVPVV
jgi:dihydrofolate synthase/folylpolyglutamate synthase